MPARGETAASVPTINAVQRSVAMAGIASRIRCIGRQQKVRSQPADSADKPPLECAKRRHGRPSAAVPDARNADATHRVWREICWRGRRSGMAKVQVGLVGCGFAAELHMHAYGRVYGVDAEVTAVAAR